MRHYNPIGNKGVVRACENPQIHHIVDLILLRRRDFAKPMGHQGGVVSDDLFLAALEVFEVRETRPRGL